MNCDVLYQTFRIDSALCQVLNATKVNDNAHTFIHTIGKSDIHIKIMNMLHEHMKMLHNC